MNQQHVDIVVRDRNGAYEASAGGKRASCTSSAAAAAQRLGEKIFGDHFQGASPLANAAGDDHNVSRWRLVGALQQPAAGGLEGYVLAVAAWKEAAGSVVAHLNAPGSSADAQWRRHAAKLLSMAGELMGAGLGDGVAASALTDEQLADLVPQTATVLEREGERSKVCMTRAELHQFAQAILVALGRETLPPTDADGGGVRHGH